MNDLAADAPVERDFPARIGHAACRCLVAGQPADGADDVDGSDLDIIDNEMCVRSLCFAVTAMSAEWVAGADDVASQCGRESTDSS